MMTRRKRGRVAAPFLPRGKRERRKVELLGGIALTMTTALIVCIFIFSGAQRLLLGSPQAAAVVSAVLVDLANSDRAKNGLSSLEMNSVLVAVAQAKANDMAEKRYFAHVSPDGVDPWHWFAEAGYSFEDAGENLAIDFSDSADVERAWMQSALHRENILNARYTEIGIATAQGVYQGRPTTFVVQAFGTPSEVREANERVIPAGEATLAVTAVAAGTDVQVLGESQQSTRENSEVEVSTIGLPWWGYALGYPRDTLRYAYIAIGLFVLFALALETGFEIWWHHRKHAIRAGMLLVVMSLFFVVAELLFFTEPVLAAAGIPL
ncbi:MAG: hypothetical protein UY63_C0012G0017 [Parcubacteria group bacterium GW2011_GWA2_51_10]|nr:MAG: hypothetical protein UY63_C0012G0017 [Parcubacteria group bacterium GW2011_GWA2_51_10]